MDKQEKAKIVVVTGGSRGIGAEIVKQLAKAGCKVILNYNKSEKEAMDIQNELQKEGNDIKIFKADVSNRKEVVKLIDFTMQEYGKIDVLINNAGISQEKIFIDVSDVEWDTMIKNNLNSVFYATQETIKNMLNFKSGCIINISSIWGVTGGSCEVAYSTAKAGVIGMTKALAKEYGPSNIRINCIAPGIIDTDMNKNLSKEDIENLKEEIPLEKIGCCGDIAKCVKWLIDDDYTTGQVISINGGWYI